MIRGKCEVNGKTLTVLFDLGATHSFISFDYMNELQLPMFRLLYDLLVSIPTNRSVKTSQVCIKLLFQIEGRTLIADLICLPVLGLDIILGMDWLSTNHVM